MASGEEAKKEEQKKKKSKKELKKDEIVSSINTCFSILRTNLSHTRNRLLKNTKSKHQR